MSDYVLQINYENMSHAVGIAVFIMVKNAYAWALLGLNNIKVQYHCKFSYIFNNQRTVI
jgi:hypothetical protein